MSSADQLNVRDGLGGLRVDILMLILEQLPTFHDVQTFLSLCDKTYNVLDHPHFHGAVDSLVRSTFGRRVVLMSDLSRRLDQFTTMPRDQLSKMEVDSLIYLEDADLTSESSNGKNYVDQVALVGLPDSSIDEEPRFDWQFLLRHQSGQLRAKTSSKKTPVMLVPKQDRKFRLIAGGGAMAVAVDENENVFTYCMSPNGKYCSYSGWTQLTSFEYENVPVQDISQINDDSQSEQSQSPPRTPTGTPESIDSLEGQDTLTRQMIVTSLGLTTIKQVEFEGLRAFFVCENGAVFVLGMTNIFSNNKLDYFGFYELTDCESKEPNFFEELAGSKMSTDRKYGIFGPYKPERYLKGCYAFLCEGGLLFRRVVHQLHRYERKSRWTPLDPELFFDNQKVVHMTTQTCGSLYILENGKMLLASPDDTISDFIENLKTPITIRSPGGALTFADGTTSTPKIQFDIPMQIDFDTVNTVILQDNAERVLVIFHTGLAISYALQRPPPYKIQSESTRNGGPGFEHAIVMDDWMQWLAGNSSVAGSTKEQSSVLFYKHSGLSGVHHYFIFN
ncbi:hypothetical protein BLNAU_10662 [Blattamonas nauphoetae]|uniref:F-box domain-containing protein n=1 Tax=Blattamonas nauphoetae TaxID=2049346 RepID=A0ABQ9XS79_9EUKA|nr:hypothetical protein BLNAU_10662 [Blattamonas nauphoetae]